MLEHLLDGEASLLPDDLCACQNGNVFEVARLALSKAGRLQCDHLQAAGSRRSASVETKAHDQDSMACMQQPAVGSTQTAALDAAGASLQTQESCW